MRSFREISETSAAVVLSAPVVRMVSVSNAETPGVSRPAGGVDAPVRARGDVLEQRIHSLERELVMVERRVDHLSRTHWWPVLLTVVSWVVGISLAIHLTP